MVCPFMKKGPRKKCGYQWLSRKLKYSNFSSPDLENPRKQLNYRYCYNSWAVVSKCESMFDTRKRSLNWALSLVASQNLCSSRPLRRHHCRDPPLSRFFTSNHSRNAFNSVIGSPWSDSSSFRDACGYKNLKDIFKLYSTMYSLNAFEIIKYVNKFCLLNHSTQ